MYMYIDVQLPLMDLKKKKKKGAKKRFAGGPRKSAIMRYCAGGSTTYRVPCTYICIDVMLAGAWRPPALFRLPHGSR